MSEEADRIAIELVAKLIAEGKAFSIATEQEDYSVTDRIEADAHEFRIGPGDGDCVEWAYVPGRGLVCVKHAD